MCIGCHARISHTFYTEVKGDCKYGWYDEEKKRPCFIHQYLLETNENHKLVSVDEWFPNGKVKTQIRWCNNQNERTHTERAYPSYLLRKTEEGKIMVYYPNVKWKDGEIISPIFNDDQVLNFDKEVWSNKLLPMWKQFVERCKERRYIAELTLMRKLPYDMVHSIILYI